MRSRRKKWAAPYMEAEHEFVLKEINPADEFFLQAPLILEVGAGKGDFAIQMAPRCGGSYLAIERDVSIAATFAKKMESSDVKNLKIIAGDFDELAPDLLGLKFDRIYLNFSDPWPKKKQGKRRLTAVSRLNIFAKLLKDDGRLYFKTDSDILYESTIENVAQSPLVEEDRFDDYIFDETSDCLSEYERKARDQGLKIHKLVLKKR